MNYYSYQEIPYKKVWGRTNQNLEELPLFWHGSGLELSVSGSELWITISADYDNAEPWFTYEINDAFIGRQMAPKGTTRICLYRGMNPENIRSIRFFRELQPMGSDPSSILTITGIETDGELYPVPEKNMKLEFIGDSLTSGEGTYGAVCEQDWIPMFMSASNGYAHNTAKALNAEYRVVSQGGWGVLCGWNNDPASNIPSVYEKVAGPAAGTPNIAAGAHDDYDFTSWQPDAIIINLGTNDYNAFSQPAFIDEASGTSYKLNKADDGSFSKESLEQLHTAILSFLKTVRKHNPNARIIWAYGMCGGSDLTPYIRQAVEEYTDLYKDSRIKFVELPDTPSEMLGSRSHPGVPSHKRVVQILADELNNWS